MHKCGQIKLQQLLHWSNFPCTFSQLEQFFQEKKESIFNSNCNNVYTCERFHSMGKLKYNCILTENVNKNVA